MQRIALTHEKLHFLYCSVGGVLYDLINVLALFQSSCNREIFQKLNLLLFLVLVRRPLSQKCVDLLAFSYELSHSNP